MTHRKTAAFDIQFGKLNRAHGLVSAKPIAAKLIRLPRLQGSNDLRGKGFVYLIKIEILELQISIFQHIGHGVRRCHQQALHANEVNRSNFAMSQVGDDRQVFLSRPFL